MLEGYTWDMTGYIQKYGYFTAYKTITMFEAGRIFQLDPEPPEMDLNDYIIAALQEKNLKYFSFFLHHYEKMLNGRIARFRSRAGRDRYDPEQFVDMKMACFGAIAEILPHYDPSKGAAFTTYIFPFVGDALLLYRMREESWSLSSLDAYKRVRYIAWMQYVVENVVEEFAKRQNCTIELAEAYLKTAQSIHRRGSFYIIYADEDSEETCEDVTRDERAGNNPFGVWRRAQIDAVRRAYDKLDFREQMLLEKRNAVCLACGHVAPYSERLTFEELAVMFEGSTASGAERAYRRAVEHLTMLLFEDGAVRALRLRQKSRTMHKKKITAAVYEYQADCDGAWGEIRFDFENGTTQIVRLADWDTMRSRIYAKRAIRFLLGVNREKLPKETMIAFPLPDGSEEIELPYIPRYLK